MVTSSAERRSCRRQRATEVFAKQAEAALDALALLDFAWHDCYGDPCPSDDVIEDVWVLGDGELSEYISAAHLAVIDCRDLRMYAGEARRRT